MGLRRVIDRLRGQARRLKRETYALYLAQRDPRVPWYARLFTALVVTYAFSPIDLIPDFIPVLGYLDDLILIPLGIYLALKLIPAEVMAGARAQAAQADDAGRLESRAGLALALSMWVIGAILVGWLLYRYLMR